MSRLSKKLMPLSRASRMKGRLFSFSKHPLAPARGAVGHAAEAQARDGQARRAKANVVHQSPTLSLEQARRTRPNLRQAFHPIGSPGKRAEPPRLWGGREVR